MKTKSLLLVVAVLLCGRLAPFIHAGDVQTDLSAAEICKQTAARYASLTSYSDEGTTVSKIGAMTAMDYTFTINLARTNLYQILWRQAGEFYTTKGVVWSAGEGDFIWMGKNFTPRKCENQEMALASATGISGGAAAEIPGSFFKSKWGNQLDNPKTEFKRKADEKIGDVDCYVLMHDANGRTNILWIGKADLLIHQIENDTSAAFMKTMMEEQAKKMPQIRAMLDSAGDQLFKDSKAVETHQNIRINPPLTKADFEFKAPTAKP